MTVTRVHPSGSKSESSVARSVISPATQLTRESAAYVGVRSAVMSRVAKSTILAS